MDVALDPPRDDLGVAVVACRELEQARDHQRLVLHQAEHRRLLWGERVSIESGPHGVKA